MGMYTNMANVQQANLEKNAARKAAIEKYATESQAAIAASKKDFSSRLQALTNVVAANHKKVEKGLTVLTGIIRDEKKMAAADRALIREQNKAMGDDMQKKIVQSVQLGEAKAKAVASQARQNLDSTTQSMLVQITNTVEKYADMAFKTIQGDHQKIADNYLSLKAYAVTANDKLSDYTEKVKVDNKVTKINGMVNEFVDVSNQVRMRWPMGLGKYLLLKLEASMSGKGVLQVDKIDEKEG